MHTIGRIDVALVAQRSSWFCQTIQLVTLKNCEKWNHKQEKTPNVVKATVQIKHPTTFDKWKLHANPEESLIPFWLMHAWSKICRLDRQTADICKQVCWPQQTLAVSYRIKRLTQWQNITTDPTCFTWIYCQQKNVDVQACKNAVSKRWRTYARGSHW